MKLITQIHVAPKSHNMRKYSCTSVNAVMTSHILFIIPYQQISLPYKTCLIPIRYLALVFQVSAPFKVLEVSLSFRMHFLERDLVPLAEKGPQLLVVYCARSKSRFGVLSSSRQFSVLVVWMQETAKLAQVTLAK